ncbi:ABC-2 family transporter protein [Kribbella kalugense]|uniref:ABC-2 type transport system permease protein n=1 Tax=Kribbella kalugense TaxID=2512221 RepID=A0A4R7ZRD9_9ACTN|nr:ABC-2 family transporter protein [Kribbella kalugense]TDW19228.1 ABC-2 type transport system permease protein [Kribbella kalugense]
MRTAVLLGFRLRQEVLEWSGAWWFLLTLVVQAVVAPLIGLFVWSAVYPDDPSIARYYVAVILVTLMTESFEQHTFSERIYDGTLSHELLRPQPVVIGVIGMNLAIRAWLTLLGAPVVVLTGFALRAGFDWSAVLRSTPYIVVAAVLVFLWTFLLALTAFWTDRVHAVVGFGSQLIFLFGGTAAPIGLLPDTWRRVAEVLPFYGMNGLPAEIAAGRRSGGGLGYQLIWVVVLVAVVTVVWRIGVRRYTAVGS